MADIVNLGDKLKSQRDADAKYAARMDLTAKMIPVAGVRKKIDRHNRATAYCVEGRWGAATNSTALSTVPISSEIRS
jgi:hypothetical protein